jgi:hypothetical protein
LKENLDIKEDVNDGVFKLNTIVERIKMYEEDGQRYLERNCKKTKISDKYFPVPDSYILKSLFNQDYWNGIEGEVERLAMRENGGFVLRFKQPHTEIGEVLDITRPRNNYSSYFLADSSCVEFKNSPYGDYKKELVVNNSFDKSRRFSIVLGLLRLICSNGAYALKESKNNFVSEKLLHLESNSAEIGKGIKTMLQKIPFLMTEANLLGEMRGQILKEQTKNKFFDTAEKYIIERTAAAEERNQDTSHFVSMLKIVEETMKRAQTVLDFVNVLGYFQVKGRFASNVRGLAIVLNNKMRKVYSENN